MWRVDQAIGFQLAQAIARILIDGITLERLRTHYNLFCAREHTVHVIRCPSAAAARAFLAESVSSSLRPIADVHRSLTTHMRVETISLDEHEAKYATNGDIVTARRELVSTIIWTMQTIIHIWVDVGVSGASALARVPALRIPPWKRRLAEARDDKSALYRWYERLYVAIEERDDAACIRLRAEFKSTLPTTCETCGAASERSVCGGCMSVCYCSRACQQARRDVHQHECPNDRNMYNCMISPE
jgi:hypothetical protein